MASESGSRRLRYGIQPTIAKQGQECDSGVCVSGWSTRGASDIQTDDVKVYAAVGIRVEHWAYTEGPISYWLTDKEYIC